MGYSEVFSVSPHRRPLLLALVLGAALLVAAVPPAWPALRPAPVPAAEPAPPPLLLYTPPLDEAAARALGGSQYRYRAAAAAALLAALRSGEAQAGLYVTSPGEPAPTGFASVVLGVDPGAVILRPWLDPALSLTTAEAGDLLAGRLTTWEALPDVTLATPTVRRRGAIAWQKTAPLPPPHSGELALAAPGDLHPGWLPVPVGGVLPSAENLVQGRYPLARRLLKLYPPTEHHSAPDSESLAKLLPAPFRPSGALTDPVILTAVGDFMLSRAVAPLIHAHGPDFLLAGVQDDLRGDIIFGNLESPIGVKGRPLPDKGIWFRAPPEAVSVLERAGVTAVTVANNHILDYDTENFLETLELLDSAGIRHAGGGRTLTEARRPTVVSAGGVRVAIVAASAFADLYYSENYSRRYTASDTLPGIVPLRPDYLAEDIKAARELADVVLVTFHWGIEYQNYPTPEMVQLAHHAIDQGADLVLGHHPHAIQGFDLYRGKFIAYSMGNFIMDDQSLGRLQQESMILHIALRPDGVQSVAVTPVLAERIGRPVSVQGAEAAALMEKYRRISGWDQPGDKVAGW